MKILFLTTFLLAMMQLEANEKIFDFAADDMIAEDLFIELNGQAKKSGVIEEWENRLDFIGSFWGQETYSLNLKNVTFDQAFKAVAKKTGVDYLSVNDKFFIFDKEIYAFSFKLGPSALQEMGSSNRPATPKDVADCFRGIGIILDKDFIRIKRGYCFIRDLSSFNLHCLKSKVFLWTVKDNMKSTDTKNTPGFQKEK